VGQHDRTVRNPSRRRRLTGAATRRPAKHLRLGPWPIPGGLAPQATLDHLRPGPVRLHRAARRRQRLPAQGRPRRRPSVRHPHGRRRRRGNRAVGDPAAHRTVRRNRGHVQSAVRRQAPDIFMLLGARRPAPGDSRPSRERHAAGHLRPGHAASVPRPWPSVENRRRAPTVLTARTPSAIRPSTLQRIDSR
jgi:hypothetical protein